MEQDGPLPDKGPSPHPTMPEIFITNSGISKLLQNLNIHKAMGPDQINAKILRELQDIRSYSLRSWKSYSIIPSTLVLFQATGGWQISRHSLKKEIALNPIIIDPSH